MFQEDIKGEIIPYTTIIQQSVWINLYSYIPERLALVQIGIHIPRFTVLGRISILREGSACPTLSRASPMYEGLRSDILKDAGLLPTCWKTDSGMAIGPPCADPGICRRKRSKLVMLIGFTRQRLDLKAC